jgi:FkbM family methyltransferase
MTSCVNLNISGTQVAFNYREDSVGDRGVIHQIFINNDYRISEWEQGRRLIEFHNKSTINQTPLIIDAGANIGASSVYFSCTYPKSLIFSIEPDPNNFSLLSLNTGSFNCFRFNGAISNTDGELELFDPGMSDWGFRTAEVKSERSPAASIVKCITPDAILDHPAANKTVPFIFKIDIEGAEQYLFDGDTSWLEKFPLVIIELHDWMLPFAGSSRNFIKAVARYEFDFIHKGENIFLFNRGILGA